jgi:hypothetical protein
VMLSNGSSINLSAFDRHTQFDASPAKASRQRHSRLAGNVTLPADPLWKRDYAASVRRFVRDGVDVPLASLFVAAARPILPEAEGAKRARRASEAFLYRRLETLPETLGRFRLNADLAIPFDASAEWKSICCARIHESSWRSTVPSPFCILLARLL